MFLSVLEDPGGNSPVRIIPRAVVADGSILIVPPDTEAYVVISGVMSVPYGPGRHTIYSGVSPFFVKFRNLMTKGNPGVSCQVYYVNTTKENIIQGGTGKLLFNERRFNISLSARAAYTVRFVINDPKVFMSKLLGMHNQIYDQEDIQPAIDSLFIPVIKEVVNISLSESSVHNIQGNLENISIVAQHRLSSRLIAYGINLINVSVTAINIPDEDIRRLTELEERLARGKMDTDIEVDNVNRVYGNVDARTRAELLTGSVRGPVQNSTDRTPGGGIAGAVAALPLQIAMAQEAIRQLHEDAPARGRASENSEASNETTSEAYNTNMNRRLPPPLPPKWRKRCLYCKQVVDLEDVFCKHCGKRL